MPSNTSEQKTPCKMDGCAYSKEGTKSTQLKCICEKDFLPHVLSATALFSYGQQLFFCSEECANNLIQHPLSYLDSNKFSKTLKESSGAWDSNTSSTCYSPENPEKMKIKCPVSYKDLHPHKNAVHLRWANQNIYFVDQENMLKFLKKPIKYINKKPHLVPADSLHCPTCNTTIESENVESFLEFQAGQRLYFCCDGCKDVSSLLKFTEFSVNRLNMNNVSKQSMIVGCPVTKKLFRTSEISARLYYSYGQVIHFSSFASLYEFLSNDIDAVYSRYITNMKQPLKIKEQIPLKKSLIDTTSSPEIISAKTK